jgi:hypothetical protein
MSKMKHIIVALLMLVALSVKAQLPVNQIPTQFSTGYFKQGWHKADSAHIFAVRDTNFTPRYAGTTVLWQNSGVDTAQWVWTGERWIKNITTITPSPTVWGSITGTLSNQTDLQNALDSKLNITDTTDKWMYDIYRRNDSVFFSKGGIEVFAYIDSTSGGGGSGTVTSVALSMPSAFNVSGSPITTSGTFNVIGAGTTSQYIRGNGTLATMDTSAIPSFYLKTRSLFSGTSPLQYNSTTGAFSILDATTTQKGVASFNAADFDVSSAAVSLADVVTAGSCINCDITFDSKGRAVAFSNGAGASGITSLNGLTAAVQVFAFGSSGTTPNFSSSAGTHTLNIPLANQSGVTSGTITKTEYDIFTNKLSGIQNVGSGHRLVVPPSGTTGNARSIYDGYGIVWDSTSNSDGLTANVDSTRGTGVPTYHYVDSLAAEGAVEWGNIMGTLSDQTDLQSALDAKLNISDTSTMLSPYVNQVGYGLFKTGQFTRVDSTRSTGVPSYYYVDSIAGTTLTNALGSGDTLLTADGTIKRINTDATITRSTNGNQILLGADTITYVTTPAKLRDTAAAIRASTWSTTGNSGTNTTDNFIGTIDNVGLLVKTNNTTRARVTNDGNVLIGTSTNNGRKLQVSGTTTISDSVIVPVIQGGTGTSGDIKIMPNSNSVGGNINFGNNSTITTTNNDNRLGIGTTSPQQWVHLSGNSAGNMRGIRVQNSTTVAGSSALLDLICGTGRSMTRQYNGLTTPGYTSEADTLSLEFRLLHSGAGGFTFAKPSPSPRILSVWSTNPTFTSADELFRISDSHASNMVRTGINTMSPLWFLHVNGSVGINKDSIPLLTSVGAQDLMLLDTSTMQVKRIKASSLIGGGGSADSSTFSTNFRRDTAVFNLRGEIAALAAAETNFYNSEGTGDTLLVGVSETEAYLKRIDLIAGANVTITDASTDSTLKKYFSVSTGASNGQVLFDNSGVFGGDAALTYNSSTDVLTVPNISGPSGSDLTLRALSPQKISFVTNSIERLAINNSGSIVFNSGSNTISFPTFRADVGGSVLADMDGSGALSWQILIRGTQSEVSTSSFTPDIDANDNFDITELAENITINAPTSSYVIPNFRGIQFRIKGDGTARTITWNSVYNAPSDFALPTSIENETFVIYFERNTNTSQWDAVGLTTF